MEEYEAISMMDEGGGLLALIMANMFINLLIYVFFGFVIGKLFEKAGKPLWAGFVPVYNLVVLLEIVGRPLWWIILVLIPFVNFIIAILLCIDLAKSYGKDTVWGILTVFFFFVTLPIMAFSGDIRYVGPAAAGETSGM